MITTIIFDWAGVFTFGRFTLSFIDAFEKKYSKKLTLEFLDPLIVQMDEGKLNFSEFTSAINKKTEMNLTIDELKKVVENSLKPNKEMYNLSKELSKKYRLIMLSNLHETTISILRKDHSELFLPFEKVYFSSEVGIKKPSHGFFNHMIKDANLNPSECVFIDDKEKNANAAQELGIKGIVFKDINQLKEEFSKLSII